MAKRSITQRWLINSVGIIFILLLAVDVSIAYGIRNYYYSSVSQQLQYRVNVISSLLMRYSENTSTNYAAEIRNVVEGFEDKELMELMALSPQGRVLLTSSGFSPAASDMPPDYVSALDSPDQIGTYIGNIGGGERVLAMTVLVPSNKSGFAAMRLVVALEEVDAQIRVFIITIFLISAAVLLVMIFSGFYFIKSIVIPVRQIGATARKLAIGDFSVRIEKRSHDEIGELCDTINHMADELAATDQMKNDFISSVSHELRTPLTAIKGWAETLHSMVDDPQTVQKGMRVISSEAERLSGMVEELLDFSRIQNGRFMLQRSNMDILAELGEAVLVYQERAAREGIEIIYNEPELLPVVYGDKNRLRQVFINIIDNAIKYSERGATITVDAYAHEDEIEIVISDTGCGISAADLPKVKTKFFKANNSRRGSGIGLAVVEEIITMHDGTLLIDSVEGEGTTVTIILPAQPTKVEETRQAEPKTAEGKVAEQTFAEQERTEQNGE